MNRSRWFTVALVLLTTSCTIFSIGPVQRATTTVLDPTLPAMPEGWEETLDLSLLPTLR